MALTKSRNRMIGGAARTPIDYNDAASDGITDARAAIILSMTSGYCHISPGTYRIASNVTLTGTVHFAPGAVLMPAAGVTVTIACLIIADRHQIFETGLGGGFVNRQGGPTVYAYPEWWDGTPNSTTSNQAPYLTQAAAFIASSQAGEVRLSCPYRINTNLTLTGVVRFSSGAVLLPAAGVTVTMDCLIEADRYQIFELGLGGAVVNRSLSPRINTKAYPEWWGALPGNGANHSPYIQSAINFVQSANGGTVHLNGWYTCSQALIVSGRVRLEGQGPVWGANVTDVDRSSTLDFSSAPAGGGGILVQNGATGLVIGFQLVNVGVFRNPPDTGGSIGLNMVGVRNFAVEGCMIFGFTTNVSISDANTVDGASVEGVFDRCVIALCGLSGLNITGITSLTFRDCTISCGTPGVVSLVTIARGPHGFRPDTITFVDCRILCLLTTNKASTLVTISDGMWLNFHRTDLEGAGTQGILIQRDATAGDHDIGLKTIDISNCWFNDTGRCVVFSGRRANGRVVDCRIENFSGGSSNISVEFSSPMDADISIRGNNIRSNGAVGGIAVTNGSGIRISDNYIYGNGTGLTVPGIVLTGSATFCIVTGNRVKTNHASPISNGGTNNVVANNASST